MASEIRVNSLTNRSGLSTVSITDAGLNAVGIITAHNFKTGTTNVHSTGVTAADGVFTGNVSITGNLNVSGVLTYDDVTNIDSVGVITARNAIVISEDNAIHFRGTAADDADAILRASAGGGQLLINSRNDAIINIDSNNDSTDAHFAVAHGAATGSSTELFRVQENGNVGINKNAPTSVLDVRQTNTGAATEIKLFNLDQSNATTQTAALVMTPDVRANGVKIVAVKEVADMSSSANKDLALTFQSVANNTAVERLRITSDGKIGIGQADPQGDLHIGNISGNKDLIMHSANNGTARIRFREGGSLSSGFNEYSFGMVGSGNKMTVNGQGAGEIITIKGDTGNLGIGGLTNPGALLSIPAGESNTPRLAIESAVDDNDFTITQYEDGNGTYTMLGQNVKLNSSGNNTILDSGHRTAGILLDARNHGAITFLTGGANSVGENVKIDSNGRLLIGTTTEGEASADNLTIADSADCGITIRSGSSSKGKILFSDATSGDGEYDGYIQYEQNNRLLRFGTATAERLRIDSAGRLLHGTTSSSSITSFVLQGNSDNSASAAGIYMQRGTATPPDGQELGNIYFADSGGGTGAIILGKRDGGTWSGSSKPGRIEFWTTPDGATSGNERMRIDANGYITKPNQPCAMAFNAQGQHMAGAAVAQFNSTRFDVGNMYNSSNGRMTAPVQGRYLVAYSGLHDYNSQNAVGFDIRINGSNFNGGEGYQARNGTPISTTQLSKTVVLFLNKNDYVDIYIRQSGTQVHQRYGSFSMTLLT